MTVKKTMLMLVATAVACLGAAAWGETVGAVVWSDFEYNLRMGNSVKLGANISQGYMGGAVIDGDAVTLDLNGYTITGTIRTDNADRILTLKNGARLTLIDSSVAKTGAIDGNNVSRDGSGGCVYVGSGCTFTMNNGAIANGGANYGGAVYNQGTFTMNGGTIANCSAVRGGAVYNQGTLTMNGGMIGSSSAAEGGAVYNQGTFTMNGGTIRGNTSTSWGYAVRTITGSAFTMTGGQIVENRGQVEGAVSASYSTVNISGGVIKGNSSTGMGTTAQYRNIQSYYSTTTITGGVFDAEPSVANIFLEAGTVTVGNYSLVGANWIVGMGITSDANAKLTGGTYTFCPTAAEYVAAGVKIAETVRPFENATVPKTWELRVVAILAKPTPVAHATAVVYTNGVLSAETSPGSGEWYAWTNEIAEVVYTPNPGYSFVGGEAAIIDIFDTTANPAVTVNELPEVLTVPVEYVDENGETQTTNAYVVVASGPRVMWSDDWHVVNSVVTFVNGADVSGAVKLILADGAKLTINGVADGKAGIGVSGGSNSFTIYGQAGGTGALDVMGGYLGAGIGGDRLGAGSNITINGGIVTATGGYDGAGIGGGYDGDGSNITINGGTVTATGISDGAGIGGGNVGFGSNITIKGGKVSATGGDRGVSGIGGGWGSGGSNIFVADDILIKAGSSANSTEVIPHASPTTDIAALLVRRRYATAEIPVEVSTWAALKSKLEVGNAVKLMQDIAQNALGAAINGTVATLDLNGFTITGSSQTDEVYRPLTLSNGAGLALIDSSEAKTGAIDGLGVNRDVNGGCIYVGSGCAFTMTGGTITNCVAARGGGVFVDGGGSFNISGGRIAGNTSTQWGGGVYVYVGAAMAFSGGEISHNTASGNIGGGGICSSGRVTMTGGTLVGNRSTDNAASTAFYSNWDDSDAIYGGVIDGTIYRETADDFLIYGGVFDRDQSSLLASGKSCTQVGSKWFVGTNIASDEDDKLTGGAYTFSPTGAEYEAVGVAVATNVTVTVSGTTYTLKATGTVELSDWAHVKANLEAGNDVRLVADVTQDAPGVAIDAKTATLDLNGFTITGSSQTDAAYRPLTLSNGANITLTDSSAAETGAIDGQGVNRNVNGGCVYVGSGCAFTMIGGTITNCAAVEGGAVYNLGAFTMNGGTICGNTATSHGSAVRSYAGSRFTMTGGAIVNNRGEVQGALSADNATVNISGGVMKGNSSTAGGTDAKWRNILSYYCTTTVTGGVFDAEPSVANISVAGTVAVGCYSQVGTNWIVGSSIATDANDQLTGGTYTFCPTNAEYAAAGVAVATNVTMTVSGTTYTLSATGAVACDSWVQVKSNLEVGNVVKLSANVAQDASGASIDGKTSTLDLNGFTITGSSQTDAAYRPLTLSNGANITLTDSSAAERGAIDGQGVNRNVDGGCVSIGSGCVFTMTGGTITNCVAARGGGVFVDGGGAFNLSGGRITGNESSAFGGGVYLIYGAKMVFEGGEISHNTANDQYGGGGICSSGNVTMKGGMIVGNKSAGNAASTAIYSNWDDSDEIYGGVIDGTIQRETAGDLVIYGGVFDRDQSSLLASGKTCTQVGSKWIVGTDITYDAGNKLTGGTYTFCPTDAKYVAAGVATEETIRPFENATAPKSWTLRVAAILALPTPIVHAVVAVYTNGVLSAETSPGSGAWRAWTNETATVVYTADAGYCFDGGALVVTNALDTTLNPAVNEVDPPELLPPVTYVDEWGEAQITNAHIVVASGLRVTWNAGWYVVTNEVTITGGADVSGAVQLILADGAKLTISNVAYDNAGIGVSGDGHSFAVYGQTEGTGALEASGGTRGAGIGGVTHGAGSNITINGGMVTVTGGWNGAGIGGGCWGDGSNITINGGEVTATGGYCAAGIGGGYDGDGWNIAINGGMVTATGGYYGTGIGGGFHGDGSNITINGGTITATGGEDGAGIGGGYIGDGSNICAGDNVIVRAGSTANPTEVVPHASSMTDIATSLAGRRYATTRGPVDVFNWAQIRTNLEAGNDVRLVKNVAQDMSGVSLDGKTAMLDLNGFTITGSSQTSETYRTLTLSNGASLTLIDSSEMKTGKIDGLGVSRNVNGGCVYVGSGCAFTMIGGTITNCASLEGGAVYNLGVFTMKGGMVTGNVSVNPASTAVYSNSDDGDAIYGGVIEGTILCADAGDFVIYGGVFDRDQSSLVASGKTCRQVGANWIVGSSIASDEDDKLTSGAYMFCPTNTEYAAVGIAVATNVTVTGSGTNYTLNATGAVELSDWVHIKANLEVGNHVRLVADVTQDAPGVAIDGKTATLDLNGFTITGSSQTDAAYRPLTLSNGANITLTDSSEAKTGAIDGLGVNRDVNGGCVYVGSGCALTMAGGTITNCVAVEGGAVYDLGAFTMTGGTITNCEAAEGGAVFVDGGGSFNISGGAITGNTSTQRGGGIHVCTGAAMAFIGGEISHNTANGNIGGGGICSSGRVTMTGGTLVGNQSTDNAASTAIYSSCDDSDEIYGGVIGGTIYREAAGDLVIYGGVFDRDQSSLLASGKTCMKVGANWIVGEGIVHNANRNLLAGIYTFCPTNAEYVAVGVAVREIAWVRENATEPKTWTVCLKEFLALPTQVAHMTAAVYTNGILSAETSPGSGEWYARMNETATVVYTADAGYCFDGGVLAVTNALDTTLNPAVNEGNPPELLPPVTYVDEWGETHITNAHVVVASGSRVMWNAGWYAVTNDVTLTGGADCSGAVKLILTDGAKLTISGVANDNAGIGVSGEVHSFAVYGQVAGTGALEVAGGGWSAGIGGGRSSAGSNITINGGEVTAAGGYCGAGIGGGSNSAGSNITINGGEVAATGGDYGAGIGGGEYGSGSNITINGGDVMATGGKDGAGIGGGQYGDGSNITINGGTVAATGGIYGMGIGHGYYGDCSNIYVADNVILKAGLSPNPSEVIPHASPTTDIAFSLLGLRYATAETVAVTYPDYLDQYGPALKAKFDAWATTFGSRDPDGAYANAFLLNVATNREAEAVEAFRIGSIAVTNGVVEIELPEPLAPATAFNGTVWLQCVTNLPSADWKDVEIGRFIDGKRSFLRCRIDFEHALTPESFPTEPEGSKTLKVLAR